MNGIEIQEYGVQRTLRHRVSVEGFGFWSGNDIRVEFCPAPENYGLQFVRTDLPCSPSIPALISYRINKPRQTSLIHQNAQVDMIEHVMAALRAAQIDNCQIRVNNAEMPGFDGSSRPFFLALKEAGIQPQSQPRLMNVVKEAFRFGNDSAWIEIRPSQDFKTIFGYRLVYQEDSSTTALPNDISLNQTNGSGPGPSNKTEQNAKHPIGNQEYFFELTAEKFESELMSCRTFLLEKEAKILLSHGLGQRVSPKDVLVFGDQGPIDNQLKFPNECARHKVLDMIGDFALTRSFWIGEIFACRTGHQQNADFLKTLAVSK